jgi:hypothetical protein
MLGDEKRAGGWFGAETINTGQADRPARIFGAPKRAQVILPRELFRRADDATGRG